jgi:hypothetical protein
VSRVAGKVRSMCVRVPMLHNTQYQYFALRCTFLYLNLNERRSDGDLSRERADSDCGRIDWAQRTLEDGGRRGTARARDRCDCARHRRLPPCLSAESRAHSTAHLTRLCQGIWKLASI